MRSLLLLIACISFSVQAEEVDRNHWVFQQIEMERAKAPKEFDRKIADLTRHRKEAPPATVVIIVREKARGRTKN